MFMKRNKHQGWKNLSTKTKVLKAAGGFNILTYIYIYITYWEREGDVIDMFFFIWGAWWKQAKKSVLKMSCL